MPLPMVMGAAGATAAFEVDNSCRFNDDDSPQLAFTPSGAGDSDKIFSFSYWVKRANIVNDPSATNRRMALYVVSEDSDGKLAKTNTIVKNNLKNWLVQYKGMNDIIDIMDAVVVNFGIEFHIVADPRLDKNTVLFSCVEEIKSYFEEALYIGEPVYITRIYEILNKLDGVADVKRVKIGLKSGSGYESVGFDLDSSTSRDGSYIKVPLNVIMELRYPDEDIVGMAR